MKRIISLSLIFAVLVATMLLALPVFAAEDGATDTGVPYYGREALANCDNSAALLYAYDALVDGIAGVAERIDVYNETDKLSQDDVRAVFDAVRRDRAEFFWLGNGYSVEYIQNGSEIDTVTALLPAYLYTGDALTAAIATLEVEVATILAGITDGMTDYDKALYLHDTLAGRIEYVSGTANAHNLYGAIVEGQAVCEGYAEALQYLLHRSGIEAFLAIGSSLNPTTGATEGHEWSYARLGGEWTHIDLTWNDQDDVLYHAYFGLTDTQIAEDHIIDPTIYALPACTSEVNDYFAVRGGVMSNPYSVDALVSLMGDGKRAQLAVDDKAAFIEWLAENMTDIAASLGVTGTYTYGYSSLGREVLVYINDCVHQIIHHVPASKPSCTSAGNTEHYSCFGCGALYADELKSIPLSSSDVYLAPVDHDFSVADESAEYLKDEGDCQTNATYWYACSHCGESAVNDLSSAEKFYTGTTLGDHIMTSGWVSADGNHYHECTVGGCEHRTDEGVCSGGTPTCLSPAVCETCGGRYGELGEHSYDLEVYGFKSPDGHAHSCATCGGHDELIPHASAEGGEATEDTPELCADCGYIITPALSHGDNHEPREEWLSDADGHWHGCTGCEEQRLEYSAHIDEDGNLICDVCERELEPAPEGDPEPEPITDPLPELIAKLTKEQVIWGMIGAIAVIILAVALKLAVAVFKRRRW